MKIFFGILLTLIVGLPLMSSGQPYQVHVTCPYQQGNSLSYCEGDHSVYIKFDKCGEVYLDFDSEGHTSAPKTFYPDIRPTYAQAFYSCGNSEESRALCDFGDEKDGVYVETFDMEGYGLYTEYDETEREHDKRVKNACGNATFQVTITKFYMTYSTPSYVDKDETYMCEGGISLYFAFKIQSTQNLFITPEGGEKKVLKTIDCFSQYASISWSELMASVGYYKAYTLELNSYTLKMPPIYPNYPLVDKELYVIDSSLYIGSENLLKDAKISLRSDLYPSENKGERKITDFTGGFYGNKLHGPYTIKFSKDDTHCPATRYLFVPDVVLNTVNKSDNVFWYEGDTMPAVSLQIKYFEGHEHDYNVRFETNNGLKVKKSQEKGLGITIADESDGWVSLLDSMNYGYTYPCECKMKLVTFTTDNTLENIYVNATSSGHKCIPVTINLMDKLKAYQIISASAKIVPPHCHGDDAVVQISKLSGGLNNPPYTFIIPGNKDSKATEEKGVWSIPIRNHDLNNVSLSIFDPEVDGDSGRGKRMKSFNFTISRPKALAITTSATNPRCNGYSNGVITVTPKSLSYPTEPVAYTWHANVYSENDKKKLDIEGPKAEGLPAGSYHVELDNNGCTTEEYFTLTEPASLVAKIEEVVHVHCFKEANGSIKASAEGGNVVDKDQKRYSFVWSNGATTQNIDSLPVGRYYLTVIDTKGCKAYANDSIQQPPELFNSLTPEYIICKGGELAIDDGKENPRLFTKYEWKLPDSTVVEGRNILIDSQMPQGQYILKSINEDNCFTLDTTYIHFADTDLPIRFLVPTESFLADTLVIAEDSEIDKPFSWYYTYNKEMFSDITNQVASFNPNLTFLYVDHSGNDTITMFAHDGLCTVSLSKNITISPEFRPEDYNYTVDAAGIFSRLQIGPNPNNGNFTLFANLIEDAPLSIALYDVSRSRKIPLNFNKYKTSTSRYQIPFQGLGLQSGIYTLLVSANGETKQIKFVVE